MHSALKTGSPVHQMIADSCAAPGFYLSKRWWNGGMYMFSTMGVTFHCIPFIHIFYPHLLFYFIMYTFFLYMQREIKTLILSYIFKCSKAVPQM